MNMKGITIIEYVELNNSDDILFEIDVRENREILPSTLHEVEDLYCKVEIIGRMLINVFFYYIEENEIYQVERSKELNYSLKLMIDDVYDVNSILFM